MVAEGGVFEREGGCTDEMITTDGYELDEIQVIKLHHASGMLIPRHRGFVAVELPAEKVPGPWAVAEIVRVTNPC